LKEERDQVRIMKFVPASGAASRMFKHLFGFREAIALSAGIPKEYITDYRVQFCTVLFMNHLPQFAFL